MGNRPRVVDGRSAGGDRHGDRELDRKKLTVPAIKTTGEYQVSAKLHSAVEFPVTVAVTAR